MKVRRESKTTRRERGRGGTKREGKTNEEKIRKEEGKRIGERGTHTIQLQQCTKMTGIKKKTRRECGANRIYCNEKRGLPCLDKWSAYCSPSSST